MNLIQLFREIKLAISLRTFYIKKAFIPDFEFTHWHGIASGRNWKSNPSAQEGNLNGIAYHLNCHFFGNQCEINRLLKYQRDERRFGWIIWYV